MALYRGEGYCFHSTLLPRGIEQTEAEQPKFFKESSPAENNEVRLKDAEFTLGELSEIPLSTFEVLEVPSRSQPRPRRTENRVVDEDFAGRSEDHEWEEFDSDHEGNWDDYLSDFRNN
jgi:hypothetical protein